MLIRNDVVVVKHAKFEKYVFWKFRKTPEKSKDFLSSHINISLPIYFKIKSKKANNTIDVIVMNMKVSPTFLFFQRATKPKLFFRRFSRVEMNGKREEKIFSKKENSYLFFLI